MEVYVDNMLTKSVKAEEHASDLKETFNVLRRYKMKLKPNKCIFCVPSGRFLGFQVHQRGIEVNPDKIKALSNMVSPRTLKDVQKLTEPVHIQVNQQMHTLLQSYKKGKRA